MTRPRTSAPTTLPPWLRRNLYRLERERRARLIALPMRGFFDRLAKRSEADELFGHYVMDVPAHVESDSVRQARMGDVCEALRGWAHCWAKLAPDLDLQMLVVLADTLDARRPLTERMIEKARDAFEATIARYPSIDQAALDAAITETQIAAEVERLGLTA